jgi:hypothetical protein
MKYLWRSINLSLILFGAWGGYWAAGPERRQGIGDPIWFSCLVMFTALSVSVFITFWRATRKSQVFKRPSFDRLPFREISDPLQSLFIGTLAVLGGGIAATFRLKYGTSGGLGVVMFAWSFPAGLLAGGVLGYAIFRRKMTVV